MHNIPPHYSPFIRNGNLAFLSGQLPLTPGAPPVPQGDFDAQCRHALLNLFSVLSSAGTSREHVLKVTAYIVGIENWPAFNRIYAEMFGDTRPARSIISVNELHFGCLVEVEAIASCPPAK